MSTKPNWKRGEKYYYIHAATMTLKVLGVPVGPIRLYDERPTSGGHTYHRVRLTTIHTKAESRKLNAKWAKIRRERRKESKS